MKFQNVTTKNLRWAIDGVTCGRESFNHSFNKHLLSPHWPGTLPSVFVLIQFAFTSCWTLYCGSQNEVPTAWGPWLTPAATQFQCSLLSPQLCHQSGQQNTHKAEPPNDNWPIKCSSHLWLPVWPGLGPACLPPSAGAVFYLYLWGLTQRKCSINPPWVHIETWTAHLCTEPFSQNQKCLHAALSFFHLD